MLVQTPAKSNAPPTIDTLATVFDRRLKSWGMLLTCARSVRAQNLDSSIVLRYMGWFIVSSRFASPADDFVDVPVRREKSAFLPTMQMMS